VRYVGKDYRKRLSRFFPMAELKREEIELHVN